MYINIFRHRKNAPVDLVAYHIDAARMEQLAREQPGFLAFRRYSGDNGEALSISEWESEADAQAWARHEEHLAVQSRGRSECYESYVVYSCSDPEVRTFERDNSAQQVEDMRGAFLLAGISNCLLR